MRQLINNITLLLSVILISTSCERKPISDDCICGNTLSIPIVIDWSTCGVSPQNVTVLFYDSTDETLQYEHIFEHNSNDVQSYVSLPTGSYTAVVFNELRDQIDYLSCVGYQELSTLKFESNSDTPARSRTTTRNYVEQSGDLAVAMIEGIVVTDEMIVEAASAEEDDSSETKSLSTATKATIESLTDVTPIKKNATIYITAHIKNLYYAYMPALADLVNLADGYYVYGDQNSSEASTLQFTMNNRAYDQDSFYDGTISTSVTAFGTLVDRSSTSGHDDSTPVTLDILFMLIDTDLTEESIQMDVTEYVVHQTLSNGSIVITIDVYFDDSLTAVQPDGSSGDSGFGSSIEDWDHVDIPIF